MQSFFPRFTKGNLVGPPCFRCFPFFKLCATAFLPSLPVHPPFCKAGRLLFSDSPTAATLAAIGQVAQHAPSRSCFGNFRLLNFKRLGFVVALNNINKDVLSAVLGYDVFVPVCTP